MNTCTSKTTSFWKERKNLILNFSTPFSFPDFSTPPLKSLQPTVFWLLKSWALFLSISSSSNSLYTWVSISTLFSLLLLCCRLGPFLSKPFGLVSLSKLFLFFCFQNRHLYFFFIYYCFMFSLSQSMNLIFTDFFESFRIICLENLKIWDSQGQDTDRELLPFDKVKFFIFYFFNFFDLL